MFSGPKIAESRSAGDTKRRSRRQRVESLVYADFGPGNGGFPIDLSEQGMAFQGIQPLERDRVISIRLKLPGTTNVVEISGRIIWLNELGTGGGLEFIDLPEEIRLPIIHWVALQSQTGDSDENVAVGTRQFEKREIRQVASIRAEIQAGIQSTAPARRPVVSSVPLPPAPAPATTNGDPTGGLSRFTDSAQAAPRENENKRAWVMPFSIGVISSLAIVIAMMFVFGVISVQLHLPQKATIENPALQAATETGKIPKSPSEKTVNTEPTGARFAAHPGDFIGSSATGTQASTAEPSLTRSAAASKINAQQGTFQKVAAAKLKAPRSINSTGLAEAVAPASVLPAMPEPALQLPAISAKTAAPAPPVGTAARQSAQFEEPRLVTRIDPIYPQVAKATGLSGSVELHFTITADGRVRDVTAVQGDRVLVGAAIQALKSWRYQPARLNGTPVETQSTTIFNFKAR
jgi:TonB family protein